MLNKLQDGRLSMDDGKTWGTRIVLQEDGGDRDIGYVRSAQRPDGKMVTTCYISDQKTGHERYFGATVTDPNKVSRITSGKL